MTKEEALNTLMKMRAWRAWGKEQKEEERPEMPEQREVDEAFDVCIELLQQPLLLSNLNKAAEKYGRNTFINECMDNGVCDDHDLSDAFKAGAEWMAGQGTSFNTKVGWYDGPTILDWPDDTLDKFEMGDEVIVQIRKKQ